MVNPRLQTCCLLLVLSGLAFLRLVQAEEVYQQPEAFISEVFDGDPPEADTLWLKSEQKKRIRALLGRDLAALRVRYWGRDQRSAWILEEIGKERPITTGLVVNAGEIERVQVLIYRETRGWEVRYPFFTEQFQGVSLTDDDDLSESIDSISGATLSVNALKKLAKVALYLHKQTPMANADDSGS